MTWSGVEPSKAELGCLNQGPMASGETSRSSAANSRRVSARRRAVEELGFVPWDQAIRKE
jgi:hypothetical protein